MVLRTCERHLDGTLFSLQKLLNRLSQRREAAPPEDNGETRAAMERSPARVWTKITLARNTCDQNTYTPRPIDAAVQDCAVHMTADALALGRHWDSLGTGDVLVTPPASQGPAHSALDTLKLLPVTVKTVSKYIENLAKGEIPGSVSASHTQGPHVLVFVRAGPPHGFRLGLHVQVQQLLNDVVHHADQFLPAVAEQPEVFF